MKFYQCILIVIMTSTVFFAQPNETKKVELSLSGGYQNYSSGSGSGSTGALLLSPRVGFYVYKGLELEPELLFLLSSGSDPMYMINGNISYNFISDGKAVPFLLVGYGLANTVPFFNLPIAKTNFNIGVLNLGIGIKMFLKEDIALRVEYRFQKFSGQSESTHYGSYSYSQKIDTRIHSVQIGISILL